MYLLTKIFFILLLLRDAPLFGGLLQINGNERRDNEGLQRGMDLELIEAVTKAVNVPVICGGGVGCGDDIVDGAKAGADAVACAAVLHYKKETVQELKDEIRAGGVEVRRV